MKNKIGLPVVSPIVVDNKIFVKKIESFIFEFQKGAALRQKLRQTDFFI